MNDRPFESWRARAAVSEALEVFASGHMQEVWTKALARRADDPEGAVTTARTLLETVCKHILEDAGAEYREGLPLRKLYKRAADVLEIAPTDDLAPILKELFESCVNIVGGVGDLRNHLSDAHGRGPFGAMPHWRHAELAVNLSGAMATYLAAIWKGRQPTVKDVIDKYIAKVKATKTLGESQRYTLERTARSAIGNIAASKLEAGDVIAFVEELRREGGKPATLQQYITFLRVALGEPKAVVMEKAADMLRSLKWIGKSASIERRVAHHEYDALMNAFRERDKDPRTKIPMAELAEFAIWSGRPISQICKLRWADVDFDKRTCRLPGSKDDFPLFERAWDIVEARKPLKSNDPTARIFPFNSHSVSASYTGYKKALIGQFPEIATLRLQDSRYEATVRLLEKSHPVHVVAHATGQDIGKVEKIFRKMMQV